MVRQWRITSQEHTSLIRNRTGLGIEVRRFQAKSKDLTIRHLAAQGGCTLADVLLPDVINNNRALVKEGWC